MKYCLFYTHIVPTWIIGAYKKHEFLCRSSHPDSQTRANQEPEQEIPARKIGLLARPFGLGWRDRNKVQFYFATASLNS